MKSQGASMLEMLLALVSALAIMAIALSAYLGGVSLFQHTAQRLSRVRRIRQISADFVHDLRMIGRFGCAPRSLAPLLGRSGLPLTVRYAGQSYPIVQRYTTADQRALSAVRVRVTSDPWRHERTLWVIASCTRYDIVTQAVLAPHPTTKADEETDIILTFPRPLLLGAAAEGAATHHLASLQVYTLVERTYQWHTPGRIQRSDRQANGQWTEPEVVLEHVNAVRFVWLAPHASVLQVQLELAPLGFGDRAPAEHYRFAVALER